jgi:hypothetical protein
MLDIAYINADAYDALNDKSGLIVNFGTDKHLVAGNLFDREEDIHIEPLNEEQYEKYEFSDELGHVETVVITGFPCDWTVEQKSSFIMNKFSCLDVSSFGSDISITPSTLVDGEQCILVATNWNIKSVIIIFDNMLVCAQNRLQTRWLVDENKIAKEAENREIAKNIKRELDAYFYQNIVAYLRYHNDDNLTVSQIAEQYKEYTFNPY